MVKKKFKIKVQWINELSKLVINNIRQPDLISLENLTPLIGKLDPKLIALMSSYFSFMRKLT